MSDKNYICPNCNEIALHEQDDHFICDSCEHTFSSKDTEYGGIKFTDTTEFKSNEGLSESQAADVIDITTETSDDDQKPELNQEDYYYNLYLNLKNIVANIGTYFKDIDDDLVKYLNDRGFFELSDKNIFIKQDSYLEHTYTSILDFSNGILDLSAHVELDNDVVDDFDTIHLTMNESAIDDILDDLESKGRDNWSKADWELINHVNTEAGKFEDAKKDQNDDKVLVENNADNNDNLDHLDTNTNLDSDTLIATDDDSNIKFKYLKIEFAEISGAPSDSIIETAMDKEFMSIDDLNKILFIADNEFRNYWSQNGGIFGYDKIYISAYYEDITTNTMYELSPLLRIDLGDGKYGKDYISIKHKSIELGAESIVQFIENGTSTNHKVKIVTESKENYSKNLNIKDVWLKYFDGTHDSVNRICEILGTTRKDLTKAYIPNSVKEIGESAFVYCTSLKSITIPNSVTKIRSRAFEGCNSIKSIVIPDSVIELGEFAFLGCYSLTSAIIGNGITSIGYQTFAFCEWLKNVIIPDSIAKIDSDAFKNCPVLIIKTNNPYAIEYCEENNIPVKSSKNTKENYNIAYSKTKKAVEESCDYANDSDFVIEDFLPFSKYMPFTD